MAVKTQQYAENGVLISKSPVYAGDKITITYNGLLAKSGADGMYVHIGYGENWANKDFIPMEFDGEKFKADFKALEVGLLNVAFKDSAENWDNNSANNYVFEVSKKAARAAKAPAEKEVDKKSGEKKKSSAKKAVAADTKKEVKKATKKS